MHNEVVSVPGIFADIITNIERFQVKIFYNQLDLCMLCVVLGMFVVLGVIKHA